MQDIKWVIFDWDGTLMDSIDRIVSSFQAASRQVKIDTPSVAEVKSIIGMSLPKAIDTLFPDIDADTHQLMTEAYRYQYIENNKTPSPLLEGAEQIIKGLKFAGYNLAISTGKARAGLNRVLAHSGIADYFDDSICADESESKPAPDMLHTLLERNQVESHQAIMIGDSVLDLQMAKHANMKAIGVTMGAGKREALASADPLHIIDHLNELYAIFNLSLAEA